MLWLALGNSLEILNVKFHGGGFEKVADIQKYCRNIKRICLEEVGFLDDEEVMDWNNTYSECIASYGGSLEYPAVFEMAENQLGRIISSCSKARFCSEVVYSGLLLPTLLLGIHWRNYTSVWKKKMTTLLGHGLNLLIFRTYG